MAAKDMERKEQTLVKALTTLESLELSISGSSIDSSLVLSNKLNDFITSLAAIYEESRSMNDSSLFPVPIELFEHVSQTANNNPDLYQVALLDNVDKTATKLKQRLAHLEDMSEAIEAGINMPPDLPPPPPPSP